MLEVRNMNGNGRVEYVNGDRVYLDKTFYFVYGHNSPRHKWHRQSGSESKERELQYKFSLERDAHTYGLPEFEAVVVCTRNFDYPDELNAAHFGKVGINTNEIQYVG